MPIIKRILLSYTKYSLEELYKTGVYKLFNKITGYSYIGSASRVNRIPSQGGFYNRWNNHLRYLDLNCHANINLQKDWNIYGKDAFEFIIVEFCDKDFFDREQYYLDNTELKYNICTNSRSSKGVVRTEEFCKKKSISSSGVKFTLLRRQRISEALSEKIYQFDEKGNLINSYKSFSIAAKSVNGSQANISRAVKRNIFYNGYIWSRNPKLDKIPNKFGRLPILQYDLQGNFIKEWESIVSASRELNITNSNLTMCCQKKTKTAKGFKWEYKQT